MYVTGLSDANMYHLDFFEGSEYERRTVKARLLSNVGDDKGHGNVEGEEVECEVYVFKDTSQLENREWDFQEFRTQKMKNWTREDYGFEDTDHLAPNGVEGEEKAAAVCEFLILELYQAHALIHAFLTRNRITKDNHDMGQGLHQPAIIAAYTCISISSV